MGCSLRVMRRECVRHLFVFRGMHRFLPTLMRLNGLGRTLEVPVHHRPRLRGKTKYGINNRLWVGLADLFGVWWLQRRTVAPARARRHRARRAPRGGDVSTAWLVLGFAGQVAFSGRFVVQWLASERRGAERRAGGLLAPEHRRLAPPPRLRGAPARPGVRARPVDSASSSTCATSTSSAGRRGAPMSLAELVRAPARASCCSSSRRRWPSRSRARAASTRRPRAATRRARSRWSSAGDYLEPTLAGRPHWTKPPHGVLGDRRRASTSPGRTAGGRASRTRSSSARPSSSSRASARRSGTARPGFVAGLVYLSSLFPAAAAAVLSADTLVALFEILAVYLCVRAWREEDPAPLAALRARHVDRVGARLHDEGPGGAPAAPRARRRRPPLAPAASRSPIRSGSPRSPSSRSPGSPGWPRATPGCSPTTSATRSWAAPSRTSSSGTRSGGSRSSCTSRSSSSGRARGSRSARGSRARPGSPRRAACGRGCGAATTASLLLLWLAPAARGVLALVEPPAPLRAPALRAHRARDRADARARARPGRLGGAPRAVDRRPLGARHRGAEGRRRLRPASLAVRTWAGSTRSRRREAGPGAEVRAYGRGPALRPPVLPRGRAAPGLPGGRGALGGRGARGRRGGAAAALGRAAGPRLARGRAPASWSARSTPRACPTAAPSRRRARCSSSRRPPRRGRDPESPR